MAAPVRWALLGSLRRRWRPWRKVAREGLKCQKEPPLARAARCTRRRGRGPPSSNMTFSTNEGTDRGPF